MHTYNHTYTYINLYMNTYIVLRYAQRGCIHSWDRGCSLLDGLCCTALSLNTSKQQISIYAHTHIMHRYMYRYIIHTYIHTLFRVMRNAGALALGIGGTACSTVGVVPALTWIHSYTCIYIHAHIHTHIHARKQTYNLYEYIHT